MSADSFHPTLVEQGFVTDEHREYADWARREYRSVSDIPGVHNDLLTAETASGDRIRFYMNEPNTKLPDNRRDGLLVRRHPFANGNLSHMHLWSQIIADVTGLRTISFPNNIGSEKAEHLSRATRRRAAETFERPSEDSAQRVRPMGFRAIAMVHAEVIEGQMLGGEAIYPFGWSEGGSAAAALYAVSGERFKVPGVGAGDPPNSVERSVVKLLKDFADETGESFIDAARRADIGALAEALNLDDDKLRKENGNRWIRNIALHPPLARIALLKADTVFDDLEDGLHAHEGSRALLFTGEVSSIAPLETVRPRAKALQRGLGHSSLELLVLKGSGHGAADQIFDQAVIADYVTAAA